MREYQADGIPIAAALPTSTPRTRRRVSFMMELAPKRLNWASAIPLTRTEKPRLSASFLDFGAPRVFNAATSIGKSSFSTRRPVLETGGQRPTARCALGRKYVWNDVITARSDMAR